VWGRKVNGVTLTFHLAGINNQNFLMRDDQTGTYWQQISGRAIAGPLAGHQLQLVPSDELTLALFRTEQPNGMVMRDVAAYVDGYAPKDWDVKLAQRYPTVVNFPEHGFGNRDVMLGVTASGESRAFPYKRVLSEKLVQDRVGSEEVILLVGPDGQSVRAFRDAVPGASSNDIPLEFFRTPDGMMIDTQTGSRWNFKGCAIDGKAKGACLDRVEAIKDFWFDWRQYHPSTTVYLGAGRRVSAK